MGLTAELELRMTDVKLVDFFEEHREAFREMAQESYAFAYGHVHPTGLPVRRDDVSSPLVLALRTNEQMRECLARKKLGQQYWYNHFADLILDRVWNELEPTAP